jgi:hypothetical protein
MFAKRAGLGSRPAHKHILHDEQRQPTTLAVHDRGIADATARYWREFDRRHAGPSLERRVEDLEHTVAELVQANNALVAWVHAHDDEAVVSR